MDFSVKIIYYDAIVNIKFKQHLLKELGKSLSNIYKNQIYTIKICKNEVYFSKKLKGSSYFDVVYSKCLQIDICLENVHDF